MRILVLLAAALVLALAGCGGDDSGGGQQLQLAAPEDGSLAFEPTELTASAGEVTIAFDNPSSTPHAVAIDGTDAASETVTAGETSVSADLEPGEYTFYCPVGDHRAGGMEGTLTVE